jgi:predicted flap endonuclease-1-like 5' DNA nuclease
MKLAEDLWLRGQAAQASMMQLIAYNTAFAGTATIQAWKLGLSAPTGFWSALGRVGAANLPPPDEIVKLATPEPAPEPVPEPEAAPEAGSSPHLLDAPRGGKADDLTVLTGVGAKLATSLNEFGIFHFDQLAGLDAEGIDWLNEQQPGFKMICARHKIVDQARSKLT